MINLIHRHGSHHSQPVNSQTIHESCKRNLETDNFPRYLLHNSQSQLANWFLAGWKKVLIFWNHAGRQGETDWKEQSLAIRSKDAKYITQIHFDRRELEEIAKSYVLKLGAYVDHYKDLLISHVVMLAI